MTRTEDLIADALQARADAVRTDRLRPLTGPLNEPSRERRRHRAMTRRLAPIAAAVAVVAVAVSAVLIAGHRQAPAAPSPAAPPNAASLPRYYVVDGMHGVAIVRSVATGKIVARVTGPVGNVAVSPDGRTFYLHNAYQPGGGPTRIDEFSVTSTGSTTPLLPVKGGGVGPSGAFSYGLAVSPDGTMLATTIGKDSGTATIAALVVIDLRTGAHYMWSGGLPVLKHRHPLIVQEPSWSGPRTLDFVTRWCPELQPPRCGAGGVQVREVNVSSGGGSLADSTVLPIDLTRFPGVTSVVADQQGHVDILQVGGDSWPTGVLVPVTVSQVSSASGAPIRVLYRHTVTTTFDASYQLVVDPSGQHLLVWLDDRVHGWLNRGTIRQLQIGRVPWTIAW